MLAVVDPRGAAVTRLRVTLGSVLLAMAVTPARAQRTGDPSRPAWEVLYPPKFYAGTTPREQAAIMATLGAVERILWKVPERRSPR